MATAQPLSFGALLRHHRVAAGLTQEALAAASGVAIRTISDLERGLADRPRASTLTQLADALQLAPEARATLKAAARQLRRADAMLPLVVAAPHGSTARAALWPPLVGRHTEMAEVDRLLAGQGLPIFVMTGEPGIGKSRLLQEAAVSGVNRGWSVLVGGCQRRSGQDPYAPLVEALQAHLQPQSPAQLRTSLQGCSWLARLLPELAERHLTPAPTWTLPPEQERRLLFAAVGRYLANAAGPLGTLLVLDDLQWAGADTLDLVAALVRQPAEPPLRLLLAARSTEVVPGTPLSELLADLGRAGLIARRLLEPLATAEVATLVANLLGDLPNAPVELEAQIAQRAGGVPFFAVSLAQAAYQRVQSGQAQGAEPKDLPWMVSESLRQRISAMPAGAASLLSVVAVAGRELATRLLLAMATQQESTVSQVTTWAEMACQAGLLRETGAGAYALAHDLIQEVVETDLGSARRTLLHRQLATALEQQAPPGGGQQAPTLAWHCTQGGEAAHALPFVMQAAAQAARVQAHTETERWYRVARELAQAIGDHAREAESLEQLASLFDTLARRDEAIAYAKDAIRLRQAAGSVEELVWPTCMLGRAFDRAGRYAEGAMLLWRLVLHLTGNSEDPVTAGPPDLAGPIVEQALRQLSPRAAARLAMSLSVYSANLGHINDALVAIERGVAYGRESDDAKLQGGLYFILGITLCNVGRIREAAVAWQHAESQSEAAGDYDILTVTAGHLVECARDRGDLPAARQMQQRARALAELLGDPVYLAITWLNAAELAFLEGSWGQARVDWEQARACVAGVPSQGHFNAGMVDIYLGALDMAQGARDKGRAQLSAALAADVGANELQLKTWACGWLAEVALLDGDPAAAHTYLVPLLREGEQLYARESTLLAWALFELGERERAAELLDRILEQAHREERRVLLADTLWVQALLAIQRHLWPEAQGALDEALTVSRAIPYPYAEAKALYINGQLHQAKGEPEQAREHYIAALAICERLGEGLYRPSIERALQEIRLPSGGT
jgi:tetratricopeptide (TPR) repeat protein